MVQFKKGHIPWIKDRHHSEETIKKMKGRHWSEESKRKLSETKKRLYLEGKLLCPTLGKLLSEETKRKISITRKQRIKEGKINVYNKPSTKIIKTCKCGKRFSVINSRYNFSKYCSIECYNLNRVPWNKGKKGLQHHSEEYKLKMSKGLLGKTWEERYGLEKAKNLKIALSKRTLGEANPLYGKHHSLETRRKISVAGIGRIHTEEYKKKMSQINKGRHLSEESKRKLSETKKRLYKEGILIPWARGKHFSKEHKRNIGILRKGKSFEEQYGLEKAKEIKNKLKEARKNVIVPFKDTSIEIKIHNFLQQLGIEYYTHKYINEIEHCYPCDIFIPSMNLVIECDGNYWHGHPVMFPKPSEKQIEQIEKDRIRTQELNDKGYKIIRLWEKDIKIMNVNNFKDKLNNGIQSL
jgi:G:T-mismatch repair DNA endonuclease (very short patch repair protein)